MEINLNSPFGGAPLSYPHWTKYQNGFLHITTQDSSTISEGDIVFDYHTDKGGNIIAVHLPKLSVVKVVNQRPAKGNHRIDNPVHQLLEVERL